eukprot:CAMPEP_0195142442 /NCGR_PEP_ID=MMETSP0448-20130528/164605_1 /TAXON_ID=66468 /ORGANISM="Heterocapsa triquestra, Strain CCMP 448" /LENGTH=49 /DNA_ID= /DNA_START= /DNA_END= /DNA_ORIENTATION=
MTIGTSEYWQKGISEPVTSAWAESRARSRLMRALLPRRRHRVWPDGVLL